MTKRVFISYSHDSERIAIACSRSRNGSAKTASRRCSIATSTAVLRLATEPQWKERARARLLALGVKVKRR
jgi:hypothetical protein